MKTVFGLAFAAAAFASAIGSSAHAAQGDTLKAVQQRGALNCTSGDGNFEGFFEVDAQGKWHGVDIDYCRAVATAIFGSDDKLKLIPISWAQRFPSLQSGDLDLVIKATGWTMSRDTELGIQFSMPYFVGATSFMAHKDLNVKSLAEMSGGTICVAGGTSTEKLISDYLKQNKLDIKLITYEKNDEATAAYYANRCDSYAEWAPVLAASRAAAANPDDHVILTDTLALEPESAAMRQGDDAWVDLVNWVIAVGLIAEENGVNSKNVDEMKANPPNTTVGKLLGVTPGIGKRVGLADDWAYKVIKTVGNAGEIYDRNIGKDSRYKLPRGLNAPWQKGGVLYPPILD
ncbi:transporter substrate-binding domain-containing protein [Mesorhizobium sp. B4-1-4]|uniref:transporter substrate-binding domain-containing protein n=1 Tax=Mesorhizobium sp. B4-1-4 TaxID=2589888 RepID=UPI00112DCEE2|nr:transporter substrate-binding domain-containing protein [Mesorhizobium sp. B4-1-4]UCI34644.1 transporter substrate-binding domain-containing protein [Mesorhizobium sp. B4-1-4]